MASEVDAISRQREIAAGAIGVPAEEAIDLSKRPRYHETFIRGLLLFCGALSILTTVGIILVLGNESLNLFARQQWEQTNKSLVSALGADDTQITVRTVGAELPEGDVIRVNDEIMRITGLQPNKLTNDSIGSGAGFAQFCEETTTDISNASRPIQPDELAACQANGRNPIEFRVGTDALAIVVNAENTFATDITMQELVMLFTEAETWSDVRPEWPNEPIVRFIPGTDSGTFDYFVEEVLDNDSESILALDPNTSENDDALVSGIRRFPYAIGFFGFAYYLQNQNALNILSIDGIAATAETAQNSTYPLARPLFIYSDAQVMQEKPQVAAFIDYYLTHVNEEIVDVGYFQASAESLNQSRINWLEAMNLPVETDASGNVVLPEVDPATVNGNIVAAGSSTVYPLSTRMATRFAEDGYLQRVTVERGLQDTPVINHTAGAEVFLEKRVELLEFFTGDEWNPQIGKFGVRPLVNSTLMVSGIAMLVALPLGMGAAIYLSEYARPRVRSTLKPVLEILAGIPTVVYGYFALTFMTPLLRAIFGVETVSIYNTAAAGIVVGILIIPLVSSMSEDALSAVPRALREASYGLGATKLETTIKVVIPAALSGIIAAFIVAISRAIGETMIVAIAAGAGPNFTFNPFESAETMTGHIARISGGDISYDSIDYNSIFAIGLALFVMTLALNLISRAIINRFREAY